MLALVFSSKHLSHEQKELSLTHALQHRAVQCRSYWSKGICGSPRLLRYLVRSMQGHRTKGGRVSASSFVQCFDDQRADSLNTGSHTSTQTSSSSSSMLMTRQTSLRSLVCARCPRSTCSRTERRLQTLSAPTQSPWSRPSPNTSRRRRRGLSWQNRRD